MSTQRPDLFTPTITEAPPGPPPWRVASQMWVAFFGGTLAVTLIAYLNAGRLGIVQQKRNLILLLGALGFMMTIIVAYIANTYLLSTGTRGNQLLRFSSQFVGLLFYLVYRNIQRPPDNAYELRYAGEAPRASLWGPGLAAVFGLGFLQNILIYLILQRFGLWVIPLR